MYVTENIYQKRATYVETSSTFKFFCMTAVQAVERYDNKRRLLKSKTPVVFATSVKGFEKDTDTPTIARVEMNDRGILRDYLGIDWDFEPGEEDKLKKLVTKCGEFATKYQTPILFYPTFSFPKKPRARTVIFLDRQIDQEPYAKGVYFIEKEFDLNTDDDGNYNIKHNFNLPVINRDDQLAVTRLILPNNKSVKINDITRKDGEKYAYDLNLINMDMRNIKLFSVDNFNEEALPKSHKKYGQANTRVSTTEVDDFEKMPRSDEDVQNAISHLLIKLNGGDDNPINYVAPLDLNDYNQFFQFLHAIARAEVIGAITRGQAVRILVGVAMGNREWEQNNIRDYEIEYDRVAKSQQKLEMANPFSYYAGIDW